MILDKYLFTDDEEEEDEIRDDDDEDLYASDEEAKANRLCFKRELQKRVRMNAFFSADEEDEEQEDRASSDEENNMMKTKKKTSRHLSRSYVFDDSEEDNISFPCPKLVPSVRLSPNPIKILETYKRPGLKTLGRDSDHDKELCFSDDEILEKSGPSGQTAKENSKHSLFGKDEVPTKFTRGSMEEKEMELLFEKLLPLCSKKVWDYEEHKFVEDESYKLAQLSPTIRAEIYEPSRNYRVSADQWKQAKLEGEFHQMRVVRQLHEYQYSRLEQQNKIQKKKLASLRRELKQLKQSKQAMQEERKRTKRKRKLVLRN